MACQNISKVALFTIAMLNCLLPAVLEAQSPLDYMELKRNIQFSHAVRDELICFSKGTARLTLHNEKREGFDEHHKRVVAQFKDKNIVPFIGGAKWEITWYDKDEKRRQDVLLKEEDIGGETFALPKDRRIAYNAERSIYYSAIHKEAYVNRPPRPLAATTSVYSNFDIRYLHSRAFPGIAGTVYEYMCEKEKAGLLPEITRVEDDSRDLIQLVYRTQVSSGEKVHNMERIFRLSPEQSYSVVDYQVFSNSRTDFRELKLIASFKAAYKELQDHQDVWVLKNVHICNSEGLKDVYLTCEIEDREIDFNMPDSAFTFDGLGVPVGTPVYDKSFGGQPVRYYYKSYPVGMIDDRLSDIMPGDVSSRDMGDNVLPDCFIPSATTASAKNKPFVFDLKKMKLIEDLTVFHAEKTGQVLQERHADYLIWDNALLIGDTWSLTETEGDNLTLIEKRNSAFNVFKLNEEFELPIRTSVKRKTSAKSEYIVILKRIHADGIWINCRAQTLSQ